MQLSRTIQNARTLEDAGQNAQALAAYQDVLAQHPTHFAVLMGAGRVSEALGNAPQAIAFYTRAKEANPDRPETVLRLAALESATDPRQAIATLEEGAARFPDDPRFSCRAGTLYLTLDDADYMRSLDLDAELDTLRFKERHLAPVLNSTVLGLNDSQRCYYSERMHRVYDSHPSLLRYTAALIQQKDYEKALCVIDASRYGTRTDSLITVAICQGALGRFTSAQEALQASLGQAPSAHQAIVACTTFLGNAPDLDRAIDVVDQVNATLREAGLERLLDLARAIQPPRRRLLGTAPSDAEFTFSETAPDGVGARAAVLVFAGYRNRAGGMPISLLDRFFAGHGLAMGVLKDWQGNLFLSRLEQLGQDFDAVAEGLRRQLDMAGITRLYTFGNSGGGFAAMRYGTRLNARRVLSFSGPSDIRKEFVDQHGDRRARAAVHALQSRLTSDALNLRGWLEAQPTRSPIHAYFCDGEPLDRVQAENLAHLPEVTLHPVMEYPSHDSIGSAIGTGQLLAEFNSILEDAQHG